MIRTRYLWGPALKPPHQPPNPTEMHVQEMLWGAVHSLFCTVTPWYVPETGVFTTNFEKSLLNNLSFSLNTFNIEGNLGGYLYCLSLHKGRTPRKGKFQKYALVQSCPAHSLAPGSLAIAPHSNKCHHKLKRTFSFHNYRYFRKSPMHSHTCPHQISFLRDSIPPIIGMERLPVGVPRHLSTSCSCLPQCLWICQAQPLARVPETKNKWSGIRMWCQQGEQTPLPSVPVK